MVKKSDGLFFRTNTFLGLYLGFLLLPVLFQTWMGFQSEVRGVWEAVYFILTVSGYVCLRLYDRERQGGVWRVAFALALCLSTLFCQNILLKIGLFCLAIAFCCGNQIPWVLRFLSGAATLCTGLLLAFFLLIYMVFGGIGMPDYEAYVPGNQLGEYATVTVTDPGAMGRVHYYATEQLALMDFYPAVRISLVTGRVSGTYEDSPYGSVIDRYFAESEAKDHE